MRGLAVFLMVTALVAGSVAILPVSQAASRNPECVQEAQDQYSECIAVCRETMQVEKDLCRSVSHDCAEACREAFITCIGPHIAELETCKDTCHAEREQAVQDCRNQHGSDPASLDNCIDQAQVNAFMCRDQCREQTQLRASLIQCRRQLRSCIQACPPATQ